MDSPRLILASASPRRRELLGALQVPFTVQPSGVDESLPEGCQPAVAVGRVALAKAEDVALRSPPSAWVLAADTVVIIEGKTLGKPSNREAAVAMLETLAGRTHQVVTAVALLGPGVRELFSVSTDVRFRLLSRGQVEWYASLEEPYDKAGAYAIQGQGAFLVESIQGSYTNVVGLPMAELAERLENAGLVPWGSGGPLEPIHV